MDEEVEQEHFAGEDPAADPAGVEQTVPGGSAPPRPAPAAGRGRGSVVGAAVTSRGAGWVAATLLAGALTGLAVNVATAPGTTVVQQVSAVGPGPRNVIVGPGTKVQAIPPAVLTPAPGPFGISLGPGAMAACPPIFRVVHPGATRTIILAPPRVQAVRKGQRLYVARPGPVGALRALACARIAMFCPSARASAHVQVSQRTVAGKQVRVYQIVRGQKAAPGGVNWQVACPG